MIVYLNGEWLPAAEAKIPIDDRGFLYGDGVYETARLHRGGYFRFHAHYRRLAAGAEALRIPVPPEEELAGIARELSRRNGLQDGSLRITLTRGRGGRGLGTAGAGSPTLLVTLQPMAPDWREQAERGWRLITATHTRHPPPDLLPLPLKSLGRIHAILARLEAEAAGADDALLLSPDGAVTEGPTWNIFWRQGDELYTPAPEVGVLEGVTRAVVLGLADELGLAVHVGRWPRSRLDAAEEIFLTMTSLGLVPVARLDERTFPEHARHAFQTLSPRYWERVEQEVR